MFQDIDVRSVVVGFLSITISLTVHEFAHAWTADRLGDDTPRRAGRVTLNPLVIMAAYPIGAVVAPLLGAFNGFLFGWAATPVNPARVRRGITIRTADLLISVAGPVSNMLLVGLAIGLFYGLDALQAEWTEPLRRLAAYLVVSNIFLAAFNLLPIPPLDGYHVLAAKAPDAWRPALDLIEQYSFMLFLLIFFGAGRFIAPLLGLLVPDEIRTYMLGAR
ncbi:MAG: site-2 protease family protein [Myxococcales bacterium]|nr:site-2 protease family protein [Myxococcales bacterium]MCB9545121.1 site-2 protease family protein [Myxococcales bacterium]